MNESNVVLILVIFIVSGLIVLFKNIFEIGDLFS